jgi:oligo-1,6-glucosidase
MHLNWYNTGTIYQIYPRSFKDSSGNGVGDLRGIINQLDYIKSLHVDIIWISPIFQSPNNDNGYDVSDYCEILPEFGTMSDFDELLNEAHSRNLKVILDLVPNHTSDEHDWFKKAKQSKDNEFRDYYIWKKPAEDGGLPNNWPSFFGGPAWTFDEKSGEYYLHLFTKNQPDLNWENPKVREEIYKVMRFWLNKGVDGFRMDVITLLSKDLSFSNVDLSIGFRKIIEKHYANGPKIHEYLNEMNEKVMRHYDAFSMGEGVGVTPSNAPLYVANDREELDMVYHFDVLENNILNGKYEEITDFNLLNIKKVFRVWHQVYEQNGWVANAFGNHDFARMVSRFANDTTFQKQSAKMLITLMATQNGTLTVYQGDEIGMTNVNLEHIDEVNDIQSLNFYTENLQVQKFSETQALQMINNEGRDNARTPMQWSDQKYAGFSSAKPWLKVNPNYTSINVENQLDEENSILNYYRKILAIKKENDIFCVGEFSEIEQNNEHLFAYTKKFEDNRLLVLLSFSEVPINVEYKFNKNYSYEEIINNYETIEMNSNSIKLLPYQALIFTIQAN